MTIILKLYRLIHSYHKPFMRGVYLSSLNIIMFIALIMVGYFSSPIIAFAIPANNMMKLKTNPARQYSIIIQQYLKTHPINEEKIKNIENQSITSIKTIDKEHIERTLSLLTPKKALNINKFLFPIQPKHLTPDIVKKQKIKLAIDTPIFLIGIDDRSITWLKQYYHQLQKLHAKGFIIQAENMHEIQTLQQQFPNLSLIPIQAGAIATWLYIQHYPVLISSNWIEQ